MSYAQPQPPLCDAEDKPCKCFKGEAAFMGPNRKFVSWQMYSDDYNGEEQGEGRGG